MEGQILIKEEGKPSLFLKRTELNIIEAATEGLTSIEIAATLGMTVKAVESLRHKAMKRLGCRNMPQVVKMLYRQKILS